MNNWYKNIFAKIFSSGNPVFFYIGVNVIVYLIINITSIIFYLFGKDQYFISNLVAQYLSLPSELSLFLPRVYTLFTYQFLHRDLFHLAFNMLTLYWLGTILSSYIKTRQFHFIYLTGGVVGGLLFLLAYNIFPAFASITTHSVIIGASGSVMAIAVAAATLVPDYTLKMLLFGWVKLKYLVMVLLAIDILTIASSNPGGSFAHLGGALMGFVFVRFWQKGKDLSSIFKKRSKLKVVNKNPQSSTPSKTKQMEIDLILDKISKSGYDKLTTEEKHKLFKASENDG